MPISQFIDRLPKLLDWARTSEPSIGELHRSYFENSKELLAYKMSVQSGEKVADDELQYQFLKKEDEILNEICIKETYEPNFYLWMHELNAMRDTDFLIRIWRYIFVCVVKPNLNLSDMQFARLDGLLSRYWAESNWSQREENCKINDFFVRAFDANFKQLVFAILMSDRQQRIMKDRVIWQKLFNKGIEVVERKQQQWQQQEPEDELEPQDEFLFSIIREQTARMPAENFHLMQTADFVQLWEVLNVSSAYIGIMRLWHHNHHLRYYLTDADNGRLTIEAQCNYFYKVVQNAYMITFERSEWKLMAIRFFEKYVQSIHGELATAITTDERAESYQLIVSQIQAGQIESREPNETSRPDRFPFFTPIGVAKKEKRPLDDVAADEAPVNKKVCVGTPSQGIDV